MRRAPISKRVSLFARCVALVSLALLSACAGTGASNNQPQPASTSPGAFVYIANAVVGIGPHGATFTGAGGITELQLASNGRVARLSGSPILFSANTPTVLAGDPLGRFLFAASSISLITYSIAPSNGALTQVATFTLPAAAANTTGPMVVDHRGKFLYSSTSAGVDVYSIASSGILASVQTVALAGACPGTNGVVLDNAGKFLYVSGCGQAPDASTTSLSVNPTTGALTMISSVPAGPSGQSGGLAVNPAGNFVYVQSASPPENVLLASNNGLLTAVETTPIDSIDDSAGGTILVHPSAKFLYETTNNSVVGIALGADGTLGEAISPFLGFPLPVPSGGVEIGLSPGGDFLLASQAVGGSSIGGPTLGSLLSVFAIDPATGNLQPIPRSPFSLDVPSGSPGLPVAVTVSQ
jgi:Lactonase, 7-bladed beta-propeller